MRPAPVRLAGLATALPPYVLDQRAVTAVAERAFGPRYADFARLARSFETAGVATRRAVVPIEWFDSPKGWAERAGAYAEGATALFAEAAARALADAGLEAHDIDAVVTVSSTGIATPGPEARAGLDFRADALRVPVFGLGCAGGVGGLALAARLARARPGMRVLAVMVETCTLNFRDDRPGKADVVAAMLFGDGAAAVCVVAGLEDGVQVGEGTEHRWPDTLRIMGWEVDGQGLGVVFDRSIPDFVAEHLAPAVEGGLARMGVEGAYRLVCHPGGPKVLAGIETTLKLEAGLLDVERAVLAEHGNMSAPTVLFALERLLAPGRALPPTLVLAALGPGFSLSMLPLSLPR